jgi:hypothetical protein
MNLSQEELEDLFFPWIGRTTEVHFAMNQALLAEDGKSIYRLNECTKAEFYASSNIVFLSNNTITNQEIGLKFFLDAIKAPEPEPKPAPTKKKRKRCILQ